MRNLIKVDMENVEVDLVKLFRKWSKHKEYNLETCEAYDDDCCCFTDNYKDFEPYKYVWLDYYFTGDEKWVNQNTGEVREYESIAFERVYCQYNFKEDKLYGFYTVIQTGANPKIDDWKFAEYMAKYSRKNLEEID